VGHNSRTPPLASWVFGVLQIASDPHHYWRNSIRSGGLLKQFSVLGSQFSGEARSLWPASSGYLLLVVGTPKTALITAYLAGKIDPEWGTCWVVLRPQFSVFRAQNPHCKRVFKELSSKGSAVKPLRLALTWSHS
jgi:hypothetical protein